MTKQIFYLKDCYPAEFYNSEPYEVICWVYRWEGAAGKQVAYSVDLRELIGNHYFEN
jgi:hypothetical protein